MATLDAFLTKWTDSEGSEVSHSQHFLIDLCDLVGLPRPGTKPTDDFRFEKGVDLHAPDGKHHGRVDLYRRGKFVLESKQLTKKQRGTKAWELAMQEALGQALAYARGLAEPPVFVIACDVGHCFELLACFDGSAHWRPFPDPAQNRVFLSELKDPRKLALLSAALREPASLDPSHRQVEITRDIADKIAHLAPALRKAGHTQKEVAAFLMRCLFTMFAEDVGLFEGKKKIFEQYLRDFWIKSPASFPSGVSVLWQTMNTGGALMTGEKVHRFNGGLFKDHSALPLTKEQLEILLAAAERDWSEVEPAIFGTLLENALSDKERHSLGAHFTPRAYVERLVRPTIEEPLRAEWLIVRSQVRVLVDKGDDKGALAALKEFHSRLCKIRVLDPACGTGNFLYVAMDLMKQLEAEVLEQIRRIGGVSQELLELDTLTLSPAQFLGIEKNPWAKEIAELVLWIGYLRWQWRLRGTTAIAKSGESILRDEKNIECRDAVLDWDGAPEEKLKLDERGKPVTRWDGETNKKDPVTGRDVPDEKATVPVYEYPNARKAVWPEADFIVGNPPFIGKGERTRRALGDGYVDALRDAYLGAVPDGADFVMYWWHNAAERVRAGSVQRFGLITSNSITQTLSRRIVQDQLDRGLALSFAVPDHPWVDADSGAAVRIAMTVGVPGRGLAGRLCTVVAEPADVDGIATVVCEEAVGVIHADGRIGANIVEAAPLHANAELASTGFLLGNRGFVVEPDALPAFDLSRAQTREIVFELSNGKDITERSRGLMVLDATELSEEQLRESFPHVYQHLLLTVRPEREQNRDPRLRRDWWKFRRSNEQLRAALRGLDRFVVTSETAKHRVFVFQSAGTRPEHKLVVLALNDPWMLGVLSSRIHVTWALAAGGKLEDRPVYAKTMCFDAFPFPVATDAQKARIRELAERLDAHRKRQLAAHPKLTITGMYNVLEKLRSGEELSAKDKVLHEEGLVSILKQLHDELDAAVFDAYGWDPALTDEQLLEKLVALNAERAAEEKRGLVRWLRPEFQAPKGTKTTKAEPKTEVVQTNIFAEPETRADSTPPPPPIAAPAHAWPGDYFARASAVRDLVAALPEGASFESRDLDALFKGKSKTRLTDIRTILETFAALGQLVTLAPGQFGRAVRRAA